MEDEMILSRPSDRRLAGEDNDLPPGPPGAENDSFELVHKETKSGRSKKDTKEKDRRRSPSRERRSRSRSREKRRSRSRGRDYSPPERRRYGGGGNRSRRGRGARSPDPPRNRDRVDRRRGERHDRSRSRDRYRSRRTRSRSPSPMMRRWSPIGKKPASPPPPPPQYAVPPPHMYNDGYANYQNQYMGQQFAGYDYSAQVAVPSQFPTSYPQQTWPQTTQPPPTPAMVPEPDEDQLKRDAAVAQEAQNQRDQLKKQRNDYLKRAAALKREMKILKEQRNDLVSNDGPPSPTTKGFLDENDRLQSQIQKKLSTIENVIDMLSSIIGEDASPAPASSPKKTKKKRSSSVEDDDDSSPERLKSKLIESMKTKREGSKSNKQEKAKESEVSLKTTDDLLTPKRINYSFYDPEMHWCSSCNVFPKTAKDYLNHLHNAEHSENLSTPDTPWHENVANDEFPTFPNVSTKRTPIRGLQFFVPSTSWFCKLCSYWMGDLHCASAHLKSKTHWDKYNAYIEQNPHFEVDWMADRQKAYDSTREKDTFPPPPPQITSVSTTGMDLLESIPLQINNQKNVEIEKTIKKKKKKSEDKKDKKKKDKKKRSKKRKKSSSSSSSSSSESSSDSESSKERKAKEDRSNSIRVAMRSLLKNENDDKSEMDNRGKWTTVQKGQIDNPVVSLPPPLVVTKQPEVDVRKKEDLMSQWNSPQPIISESEKKLLEELKGKLKTKPVEVKSSNSESSKVDVKDSKRKERSPKLSSDNKEKSRKSRTPVKTREKQVERRSRSRDRRSRSRDQVNVRSRDKPRSRSRDKRSRSRDRKPRGRMSPDNRRRRRSRSVRRSRSPRRRSRSPSNRYGRRRSYSRSRSRSNSRRIEKPIVRYPEFRPRVPPPESKKTKNKTDNDSERKKSPNTKKQQPQAATGKKLPFIGRMPVFKKQPQGSDGEKKEGESMDEAMIEHMHMGYDHYDGMSMMMDYDDLMPDPMQFVTLMGAPPPPPSGPPPEEEEKDILPPGIDESEADSVPKPINDAPLPRKGPLPKDFEEALNIIFPGERKPDDPTIPKEDTGNSVVAEQPPTSFVGDEMSSQGGADIEVASMSVDEASQQSIAEAFMGFPSNAYSENSEDLADITIAAPPPPPPPLSPERESKSESNDTSESDSQKNTVPSPKDNVDDRRKEELDDLAMLGIDADDLAAQCI